MVTRMLNKSAVFVLSKEWGDTGRPMYDGALWDRAPPPHRPPQANVSQGPPALVYQQRYHGRVEHPGDRLLCGVELDGVHIRVLP